MVDSYISVFHDRLSQVLLSFVLAWLVQANHRRPFQVVWIFVLFDLALFSLVFDYFRQVFTVKIFKTFDLRSVQTLNIGQKKLNFSDIRLHLPFQLNEILHDINFIPVFVNHLLVFIFILLFLILLQFNFSVGLLLGQVFEQVGTKLGHLF